MKEEKTVRLVICVPSRLPEAGSKQCLQYQNSLSAVFLSTVNWQFTVNIKVKTCLEGEF